jgi:hypothetical protein
MPDLKQELADLTAAVEKAEEQAAVPANPVAPGKVRLRHPLTGDTKDVDATPAALIPLMGLGYQQVKG